jgi:hypothetical protein
MTRAKRGFGRAPLRSARIALVGTIVVASAILGGCNGSDDAATAASATGAAGASPAATAGTNSPAVTNAGPTLQGTAITTATVGTVYSFQPQATNPASATLTFSVTNKPAWATFSAATGQLSGTPSGSDVGSFAGIQISASDGTRSASLPAFAIAVSAPAAGASSINLTWQAPTENSDGSPLTDLKGYKIHYGTQSQNYTGAISVDNPTLTTYLVSSLPAGKYYFAVTAFNSHDIESSLSDEISATFN